MQLDVAGLVDTVHVAEAGGNGEVGADLGQRSPDLVDIFGLGVEGVVVDVFIVYTVLLSTSDTNFLVESVMPTNALEVPLPSQAIAS